jgi:hypothetical protein
MNIWDYPRQDLKCQRFFSFAGDLFRADDPLSYVPNRIYMLGGIMEGEDGGGGRFYSHFIHVSRKHWKSGVAYPLSVVSVKVVIVLFNFQSFPKDSCFKVFLFGED